MVRKSRRRSTTRVPRRRIIEFARWRNVTGRVLRDEEIGGAPVRFWAPGDIKSVPEEYAQDAEAIGLERVLDT